MMKPGPVQGLSINGQAAEMQGLIQVQSMGMAQD